MKFLHVLTSHFSSPTSQSGMTLIETLVAISILSLSIVAPMTLTMQSLSAAYFARDQVIASNLAQEAAEAVRARRDANILIIALDPTATCNGEPMDIMCGIPLDQDFTVDVLQNPPLIDQCSGDCVNLRLSPDGLYGYEGGWDETQFRRIVHAENVNEGVNQDEIRLTVTVERINARFQASPTVIQENLYRWVRDSTAEEE